MVGTIGWNRARSWSRAARETAGTLSGRPESLRWLTEGLLALLLVAQAVWLVWALAMPGSRALNPVTEPTADLSVLGRFDAFFRTGGRSSLAEVTAAGSEQLRLFGVRAGGPGAGSAIIGLADGRQVSVGVGETIEPGLVLSEVGADYVTVARGASISRIDFSEAPTGAAAPPPPPTTPQIVGPTPAPAPAPTAAPAASAPTGPVVDPRRLMAQASLRPRMKGLSINGFTVSAGGDGSALRAAGLQSGDVILAVNGTELNSLGAANALRTQLAQATSAEIRYERNGQVRTTTIRTGS